MSELDAYLALDYPLEVHRIGERFYVTQTELNLTADDADLTAAYQEIERKKKAMLGHHAAVGSLSSLPLPRNEKLRRELMPFFIKLSAIALVGVFLFSVASISFSYALRDPLKKMTQRTARAAMSNIADELTAFANDPQSKEREERIRLAIREALPKLKPYVDELRPLFAEPPASR
ncbi:MAG: hypothetical protein NWT00_07905 [Beijerinckiaceae bacterium]|jgi:hypothetical protein|nr:hypothetical protein [Beijerinckiaceae bacterium]